MKLFILIVQVFLIASITACKTKYISKLQYIDSSKPSTTPLLFAKDFITKKGVSEYGSVFNHAGDEFYFAIDEKGKSYIMFSKLINGKWSEPQRIFSPSEYSFNDPFLSNDENKLYYISNLPNNPEDKLGDYDIWFSEKLGEQWSEPINAGSNINSGKNEYYISFSEDGSMYYSSNLNAEASRDHDFDIYKSAYINNEFQKPQKLAKSINTRSYEADVFIAPDESYIIFCSRRNSGMGRGDLYISFNNGDEDWTEAINMGPSINSENHELCPFVTKDGKYFFYTSDQDLYWVSTEIFSMLKQETNK